MKNSIFKLSFLVVILFSLVILTGCPPRGAQKVPGGGSNDTSTAPIKPVRE